MSLPVSGAGGADATNAAIKRILSEQLARELWKTANVGGAGTASATAKVYDSVFSQTLADALSKDAK